MPLFKPTVTNCVAYLYRTKDAAEKGENAGGSGFIVGIKSEAKPEVRYFAAVTCAHVVFPSKQANASPVVRLNLKDGGVKAIELTADKWIRHPEGDDIAVAPLPMTGIYDFGYLDAEDGLLDKRLVKRLGIDIGDDLYMVGRFIGHEGKKRNYPTLRFGNISMMPTEPIRDSETKHDQESFLIEVHSIEGYSGSPAFVYIQDKARVELEERARSRSWLLGIVWAYLRDEHGNNSGMAAVVPAWKLDDLLFSPRLKAMRARADRLLNR